MFTRKEYLVDKVSDGYDLHHRFFFQFTTPNLRRVVIERIGSSRIKNSNDKYFNDIPLAEWDSLVDTVRHMMNRELFRLANNNFTGGTSIDGCAPKGVIYWSTSEGVSIAKACAAEHRGPYLKDETEIGFCGQKYTFPAMTRVSRIKGADGGKGDLWAIKSAALVAEITGNEHDAKHRYCFVDSDKVWSA